MSLTTSLAIFPGFKPGQSFTPPPTPIRAQPSWNFKETAKWNNSRQEAINGRVSVVKYWNNPKWDWEWIYSFMSDDPSGQAYGIGLNQFYPQPIPATDLGVLKGFYHAMQGANMFAYQPPDCVIGGNMSITAVSGAGNLFTLYGANNAQLGNYANISGLGPTSFLDGNRQVLACSPLYITVYLAHADYALTADSGSAFIGQLLSPADANNNSELVHTIGAYPAIPLTGTPPTATLATESVQLIDSSTLQVQANGTTVSTITLPVNTVPNYQGLVLNFASAPTPPIVAAFSYYYPVRFSEDTQEYENFSAMLYSCSSVKMEQDRL
jgi:hypothetical protein